MLRVQFQLYRFNSCGEATLSDVGQISKSLVFEGAETGKLRLLLVSGKHDVNLDEVRTIFGESLHRADPKRVREETGFAIGGVSPNWHLCALETWMDQTLLGYCTCWDAAGRPNAVFEINTDALAKATGAGFF